MPSGEKPGQILSLTTSNTTVIARGQAVVRNNTGDDQIGALSGANTARPYGIAMESTPNPSAIGTVIAVGTGGIIKGKIGTGGCTAGSYAESDASGNFINATAGAGRNVFGQFAETGIAGDLIPIVVRPQTITV